jgi:hypothetical protein
MRTLSLLTDELGACVWDLDALTPEDRRRLLSVALDNKIVIAHNAGIGLSWLFVETEARPAFVLDSMLLMRQLRPETLLRPFKLATTGDENTQTRCQELIAQEDGVPAASLEWIATYLALPVPDVSYQRHTSWGVSNLSGLHHEYATTSAELTLRIVRFLLPGVGVHEMPAVIQRKYSWYTPYATAIVRLAEAHVRGVPFDTARLRN